MKSLIILLLAASFSLANSTSYAQEKLQSPSEYLGYTLGTRFTNHYKVLEYFYYVSNAKANIKTEAYGETNEHRPLVLTYITSTKNFEQLEELRKANLFLTGLEANPSGDRKVAIVWLSYNVHGNESSSTEAAMATLYELADEGNERTQEWLKNTIVIIDPCVNPDGRDRYVNWYNQYGNKNYNPDPNSTEHLEPWPGGRQNHYLFDLNRDWAWQTQIETVSRIKKYNEWMPHVHVDFHEQYIDNPYYFAPAAEPYHEVITDWQREFQTTIGKNNAKYFDENGWLYFTKEFFDLLYPSYGDSYPTYNGSIGMTYEQAGHGMAGLGILTHEEDTLTLVDRIKHHTVTSLSTIEITSLNADKVISEFAKYFDESIKNPKGKYKTYIIKAENGRDKLSSLMAFLDKQKITYGKASSKKQVKAFDYLSNSEVSISVDEADLVISTYQSKSNLLNALFEPETKLADSVTYDITAWALPYSWGLKAFASPQKLDVNKAFEFKDEVSTDSIVDAPYAYVSKWNSMQDVQSICDLLQKKIKVRYASEAFDIDGETYAAGSMIITNRGNENLGEKFKQGLDENAKKYDREFKAVNSGFVSKGKDFGSQSVHYIKAPKVAVVSGKAVSVTAFGEVWFYFEQEINYPITVLNSDYFDYYDINDYDVIILPNGYYGEMLSEDKLKELKRWVSNGGRLILMENALRSFVDKEGFNLKKYVSEKEKTEKEKAEEEKEKVYLKNYDNRERAAVSEVIYGSVFKTRMDPSHPLGFGYTKEYFTLKRSAIHYAYLTDGWNVSVIEKKDALISGFAGYEAIDKMNQSLVFGVEDIGEGKIIYMVDNPLFRDFWENGKLLFANAVFLVGQ
jgi:hypothetical protein